MGGFKDSPFFKTPAVVFWNLEDYPITSSSANLDLVSIYDNISSALGKMGYTGHKEVCMFGDKWDYIKHNPLAPLISYKPQRGAGKFTTKYLEVGENAAEWNMATHIVFRANWEMDVLVLAKKKPDSEVFRVLQILKSIKFNVFLLVPPPDSTAEDLFSSVDSILASTQRL